MVETFAIADDHVAADGTRVLNFAQTMRRALDLAPIPAPGPLTVADALAAYFVRIEQKGKKVDEAQRRAEIHILPGLGATPVDSLTREQLDGWLAGVAKGRDGAGPTKARQATANRVLTILKAALNMAFEDDKCATGKAWKAAVPFADVNQPRIRFFTREEVTRLLNAAQGDFRDLCKAALFTGCRYGELRRLRVDAFDPDSGTVFVAESKSGKPRHVHMTAEARRFFESLTAGRQRDANMLTNGGKTWADTQQAGPMTKCMAAARVERASFHVWRHTWASMILMSGVPIAVVAENLGYSDSRVTAKHYAHLSSSYR